MAKEPKADGARSVKSAERVFDLLESIGARSQGITFVQLGAELGIPKSSLHALLEVLLSRGYIELDPLTRRYSLGIRIWETGQAYQRHHNVIGEARAVLESIVARVNETAQLAKLVGRENVYLAKVDSTHVLRLQSEVGSRLSAHATGVGKALLAQLTNEDIRARFGTGNLPVYTASTIPTVEALIDEMDVIRQRGFAVDNEEYTPGVFCLAVPVHDTAEAASTALSVSVPVTRVDVDKLPEILAAIAEGSLQIAIRSGGRGNDPQLRALADLAEARRALEAMIASGRYKLAFAEAEAL